MDKYRDLRRQALRNATPRTESVSTAKVDEAAEAEKAQRKALLGAATRLERVIRAAGEIPNRSYLVPDRGCWRRSDDDGFLAPKPLPASERAIRVLLTVYAGCTWRGLIWFDLYLDGPACVVMDGERAGLGNWRDAADALDAAVLNVLREQVGRHHPVCGGTDPK